MLVMSDPRRLAGDAVRQRAEPAPRWCVQHERHELRREDDPPDAEPVPGGLTIDFQQQGCEGLEVDPAIVPLAPMVELEPVAEPVPRPGADLGSLTSPGPERHEHVHRHPVLVRAVRPEPPSPWPAGLAHDEPAPVLGPRPRGEGGEERVADPPVDVLPAQRRPEERVRDVPRSHGGMTCACSMLPRATVPKTRDGVSPSTRTRTHATASIPGNATTATTATSVANRCMPSPADQGWEVAGHRRDPIHHEHDD